MSDMVTIQSQNRTMTELAQRYQGLPRHLKWLVWLVAGVIVYFLIVEPVLGMTGAIRARADALASMLERQRTVQESAQENSQWAPFFGDPQLIAKGKEQEVGRVVYGILGKHGILPAVQERPVAELRVTGLSLPGKYKKQPVEVQFSASQDVVSAVLVDLEKEPTIARIGRVEVKRNGQSTDLQVKIEVESWYRES